MLFEFCFNFSKVKTDFEEKYCLWYAQVLGYDTENNKNAKPLL